jgi:hypothetical protein
MIDHVAKQHVELAPNTEERRECFPATPRGQMGTPRENQVEDNLRRVLQPGRCPTLYDMLGMGPNLFPEILATLLRFLERPIAIIRDIQQAFLQHSLDRRDRDLTMFL